MAVFTSLQFRNRLIYLYLLTCLHFSMSQRLVTHVVDGSDRYCYPVTCNPGTQISFCRKNNTRDECRPCPDGTFIEDSTNSQGIRRASGIPKCQATQLSCSPESTLVSKNGGHQCECDTSRGYVGEDSLLCIKVKECAPGQELHAQERKCKPCKEEYYKPTDGYQACTEMTNCERLGKETIFAGNETTDKICGESLRNFEVLSRNISTHRATKVKCMPSTCGVNLPLAAATDSVSDNSVGQPVRVLCEDKERVYGFFSILTAMCGLLLCMVCLVFIMMMKIRKDVKYMKQTVYVTKTDDIQEMDNTTSKEKSTLDKDTIPKDDEQPETIYPLINSRPCTPTAPMPSMSVIQPTRHPVQVVDDERIVYYPPGYHQQSDRGFMPVSTRHGTSEKHIYT